MPKNNNKTEAKAQHTPFAVVEAYNTIRTNLLFVLAQQKGKVITVSSANPGDGKSTTALNIASSFSQLGSKTLLIDADLRKPIIHKRAHLQNSKGLSSVLVGFCSTEEAINSINPFFDILTSGPTPPNPTELLASNEFDELVKKLKEEYDYIIIDTPPVNIVSDSIVVAPRTDGILLVVKDRKTYHEEFKMAVSSIEFSNVRILGVVINALDIKNGEKYKYKYKYKNRYRYRSYDDSAYINSNNK